MDLIEKLKREAAEEQEEQARKLARANDPETSKSAAISVVGQQRSSQLAVLRCFERIGGAGLTDDELVNGYREFFADLPQQSESGLRTRRHELVEQGFIEDSGERRKLASGRSAIVWNLVRDGA
jgi:hypothetical protein